MKPKKLFIIGIIATTLSLSAGTGAQAQGAECSIVEAYENAGVFMASVIGYDDAGEYWLDILRGLKHRSAHRSAIDNQLAKLSKLRKQIRTAYLQCNQTLVTRLKDNYYRAQLELEYIRNFDKPIVLALMRAKADENLLLRGEFTEKNVEKLYRKFETTYKSHHTEWKSSDTGEVRELAEAWERLKRAFLQFVPEGGPAKDPKKAEAKAHQSPGSQLLEYLGERLEFRLGNVAPPLTITDIVKGKTKEKASEAGEFVEGELEGDLDVRSRAGEEDSVEMIGDTLHEGGEEVEAKNTSLVEIWKHFENAESDFKSRFGKAELMGRYDIFAKGGGDDATESLVDILEKTKKAITDSLIPLAEMASCAEQTQSRQCSQ